MNGCQYGDDIRERLVDRLEPIIATKIVDLFHGEAQDAKQQHAAHHAYHHHRAEGGVTEFAMRLARADLTPMCCQSRAGGLFLKLLALVGHPYVSTLNRRRPGRACLDDGIAFRSQFSQYSAGDPGYRGRAKLHL